MTKKIAFCFSGQARTLDYTYEYHRKHLFLAAEKQGFEYDIFCAVENDTDVSKIDVLNSTIMEKIERNKVSDFIHTKYAGFIAKYFNKKYYFYETHWYNIWGFLKQFYNVYRANDLKSEYEKENKFTYDIVVRLRFDVIFLKDFDFENILKTFARNENTLLVNLQKDCLYDHFAVGTSKSMDMYANSFGNFSNIFQHKVSIPFKSFLIPIDTFFSKLLIAISKPFSRGSIMDTIIWQIFGFKLSLLVKLGLYYYTNEKILYEHLLLNKIDLVQSNISFLLLKSNFAQNPVILFNESDFDE